MDFSNQNIALTWQNPFSAINGWAAAAGFPTGQGSLSLPPDNRFHQGTLLFGYNISDRTRFTADAALGRMTQNDPFLPITINPVLAASITEPLPRDSLDGEINTTVINVRLSSRPTTHFNYGASFRYDDRDNNTPIDQYVYIGGDSTVQNTAAISDRRRFNEPYSYREYKYKLDAGYRLDDGTRFTGGANRVNQVVDPTRFWTALHRDRVDTGGFNLTWKPSDQRLQFGFDLMLSTSRDDIEVSAGSALTTAPLPTNRVTIRSGSLYGQYRLSDSLSLRATVQHEHYRSSDFALDGVEANQLANVILFGEEVPDFDVTVGTLTMVYTF